MGLPTDSLTSARSENAEIYLPELGKWLEVRSRYLSWVDGRLAQMVIATDITPRRLAEEQADRQAENAQSVSRLITMGEMASSVAHELNQPLTAISNYCSGMLTRLEKGTLTEEQMKFALEKTAHQAQRAGQIILRIRSFVKRSEPNRTLAQVTDMVSEAVELAGIELRRRNVQLTYHVAERMPAIMADTILIEQVLVNLMKNGAESIEQSGRPSHQRNVELRVVPRTIEDQRVIEFNVQDTGKGLPPEVLERLFEAFFTTKSEGMGMGLNLCRSIVESHQGRMRAREHLQWIRGSRAADSPSGCRWQSLPDDTTNACSDQRTNSKDHCMSLIPKKGTVYVVDDDEAVRDSLQWLLEGKDYRVRCFDSAETFLSRYDPREDGLPDRGHPHGRHDRPGIARPLDRTQVSPAHRFHHRPRRCAHGREHHEERRAGFHSEAFQRRRTAGPGGAHARPCP